MPRKRLPRPPAGAPGRLAVLLAALAAGAVAALLLPAEIAATADAILAHRPAAAPALTAAGLLALGSAAEVASGIAAAACTGMATARARRGVLRSALVLGAGSGPRQYAPGDLISRLVGNCADAGQAPVALAGLTIALGTSAAAATALWRIDPWLGAAFAAGMVPIVALARSFSRRSSTMFARYQEFQGQISTRLTDALAGIRTIRANGTADTEAERILAPLPGLSQAGQRTWQVQRAIVWRLSMLAPAIEVVMLTVAGLQVAAGRIPAGDMLATAGYTAVALGFLDQLDSLAELARAQAGARRAAEVSGAAAAVPGADPLPHGPGLLEWRDVTVRSGGHVVLDRVCLQVTAGIAIALVGRSGSGKSTMARLIGRLAEPDEGEVLIDGARVADISPAHLRREVAYAFERPALLGETIEEAVTYAAARADRQTAVRAARLAGADGFIRRLPGGYDTPVRGLALSGGEVQRIGIARALAQDARILILDDATSSLDTATEMQISRALAAAAAGRTRVVVAQRAATAQRSDMVAWLEEGRLRGVGPHERLWRDPDYRAVFGLGRTA